MTLKEMITKVMDNTSGTGKDLDISEVDVKDLVNDLLGDYEIELSELNGYDDAIQEAKDEAITDMR